MDDPSRRRLPPLLRQAWFGLNQAFRRRLAPLKLTPDQFTILRWLIETRDQQPGITQRQLADLMTSDPNTIAALLSRMEAAGLVDRHPHARDARAKQLAITPRGQTLYQQARALAIDLQSQILDALPASRRDRFLADLEQLAQRCRDV